MAELNSEWLEKALVPRALSDSEKAVFALVQNAAKGLMRAIVQVTDADNHEGSIALERVEEAVLWTYTAIMRKQE